MSHKPLTIVATIAGEKRSLSVNGALPLNHREEKLHFNTLAAGQAVIIGRRAFEANVRDLQKSSVVVLTRDISVSYRGVTAAYSIDDAIQKAPVQRSDGRIIVVGGAETFREFLPYADTIELTMIHKNIDGDLSFPEIPDFTVTTEEPTRAGLTKVSFVTLERA